MAPTSRQRATTPCTERLGGPTEGPPSELFGPLALEKVAARDAK